MSNNNIDHTCQVYDSEREISSFFDAVASQKDEEDEEFGEEEHEPVPETTDKDQQQKTEVSAIASLPNFHKVTVAHLKVELRKRNLH